MLRAAARKAMAEKATCGSVFGVPLKGFIWGYMGVLWGYIGLRRYRACN